MSAKFQEKIGAKKAMLGKLLNVLLKVVNVYIVLLTVQGLCMIKLQKQQNVI